MKVKVMVEKEVTAGEELHIIKYNKDHKWDINTFVSELKSYYIKKYGDDKKVLAQLEAIQIVGNDKFSIIKNIPSICIDGKTIVGKITEDLIKLIK